MQHSGHSHLRTVLHYTELGTDSKTARVHRLSTADTSMRRVIITMVNGNGQVTDLDEAGGQVCVWWEQLKCKQGHR